MSEYNVKALPKDALVRAGGPELTEKLLRLCAQQGDVRGSTGTIHYANGHVSFTPGAAARTTRETERDG